MLRQFAVLSLTCIVLAVVYGRSLTHRWKRWEELPNVTFHFDCSDKSIGFYADTEFDCTIFHMCDVEGRRIPHLCGNGTAFNQQYRICDWIYNINCGEAPNWYYLNDLTYVTDPPKVAVRK